MASEMTENERRQRRQQRLQHLHGMLVQLVMHEGRFVSERTNNFLLYNSIFFGGFLLLRTQLQQQTGWSMAAGIAISSVGIIFSFLFFIIIGRTIASANFWRSTAGLIQQDPDFWFPGETIQDADLDFFSARNRSAQDKETRQRQHPLELGGVAIKRKFARLAPNFIFGTLLPIIIGLLWVFALVWTIKAC